MLASIVLKIRYTFPLDIELIGCAKGLVAGSKGASPSPDF
jgi:hypothetical protein